MVLEQCSMPRKSHMPIWSTCDIRSWRSTLSVKMAMVVQSLALALCVWALACILLSNSYVRSQVSMRRTHIMVLFLCVYITLHLLRLSLCRIPCIASQVMNLEVVAPTPLLSQRSADAISIAWPPPQVSRCDTIHTNFLQVVLTIW